MIQLDEINDSFYYFPYQPSESISDSDTPAPNVGGLDLITQPEMIENIPEIKYSPMLKKLLIDLNSSTSPYISLGCGYWANYTENEASYCYLEFSFRDPLIAKNLNFIQMIDEKFIEFLHKNRQQLALDFSVPEQAFDTVHQAVFWSYRPYSYFGSEERILLYFQAGSPHYQDLEIFLDLLHRFLTQYLAVSS
ncbi:MULTISPECIES: hypothetical protein [unclassified Lonepinella]|uniref:hypothetical protein n=1 Tax=unclassified Lonepinella TaxID=2642006 RepID=UPI0036DBAE1C